jgi:hypothetical protein
MDLLFILLLCVRPDSATAVIEKVGKEIGLIS